MSIVYLAEHDRLRRKVALKVMAPALSQDDSFRRRFEHESQRAAELEHPSIIPIYDAGESEGLLYIAMRYVDGPDLKRLLARDGPLNLGRALFTLEQVADALDAAHERNLIHRDIKPSNILIAEPSDAVFLTDFGIVKHTESKGLTKTGFFIGTPDYAPPELIEGLPVDARTDVYSLTAVLYECLTGKAPFSRQVEASVMHAHLVEPPPRLTDARPDLPKSLNSVITSGMAKAKDDRFPSCEELIAAARAAALKRHKTTLHADTASNGDSVAGDSGEATRRPPAGPAQQSEVAAAPVVGVRPEEGASLEAARPEPVSASVAAAPPAHAPPPAPVARRQSPWLLALIAAVAGAIGAAGAGVGVYFATRTTSSTSASATAPAAAQASVPVSAAASGAREPELEHVVPKPLWKDCRVEQAVVVGAADSAVCIPSTTAQTFFPIRWDISRFEDRASLNKAYASELAKEKAAGAQVAPNGRCDGAGWNGEGKWFFSAGRPGGERFCYFEGDFSVFVWSHPASPSEPDEPNTLMRARAGSTDQGRLFAWWRFWRNHIGEPQGGKS
jgi:serine/threonine-protein kinase